MHRPWIPLLFALSTSLSGFAGADAKLAFGLEGPIDLPGPCADLLVVQGLTERVVPTGGPSVIGKPTLLSLHRNLGIAVAFDGSLQGGLAKAFQFNAGNSPLRFNRADTSGDGLIDIVTVNTSSNRLTVARQVEPGQFQPAEILPVGTSPRAVLELPAQSGGERSSLAAIMGASAELWVLKPTGASNFALDQRLNVAPWPTELASADLNGDGLHDLVITHLTSSVVTIAFQGQDGRFTTPTTVSAIAPMNSLVLGDFNADGDTDIAVAGSSTATIQVYFNNGGGGFAGSQTIATGQGTSDLHTADLDRDGDLDFVVANAGRARITVAQRESNGTYTIEEIPLPFDPGRIEILDFSGDGRKDIVLAHATDAELYTLLNETIGEACPGDVNGDLRVDLRDLNTVLSEYGGLSGGGDANADGSIDLADLNLILSNFGAVCGET